MNPELRAFIESLGLDPTTISADQLATIEANWAGRTLADSGTAGTAAAPAAAPSEPPAQLDDVFAAQRAERDRHQAIADVVARNIEGIPLDQVDAIESAARLAIEAGHSASEFELQLLRQLRPSTQAPRQRTRTADQRVIEAALCQSGGLPNIEEYFSEETLEAADSQYRHGLGLCETILLCARQHGHNAVSVKSDIEGALRAGFPDVEAQGFSTVSLPGILSNTANKFFREGFMAIDQAWREVSGRAAGNDFKEMSTYTLTGDFEYKEVGAAGEIQHGEPGEERYTNQISTYARMLALTRRDIINDDTGALTSVPRRLGRGAALAFNKAFWAEFLDNATFFTAENKNLLVDPSALDADNLAKAEVLFWEQTDPDGQPLGIMPAVLLVPPQLYNTALQLMSSTLVVGSTDRPDRNVQQGRYRVVTSPYLSNTSISGSSTQSWYLTSDPADVPVIQAAFLNGRDVPTIEQADADFRTLGITMRGYMDYGIRKQEYRAGVKAPGGPTAAVASGRQQKGK